MAKRKKKKKNIYRNILILLILLLSLFFYRFEIKRLAYRIYYEIRSYTVSEQTLDSTKVKLPSKYHVVGIDVSRYQAKINWDEIENETIGGNKISFVFAKATEGEDWEDPLFKYNWRSLKKRNFIRGAYHFYSALVSSEKQIKNFVKNVDLEIGDLPPVLDVEVRGKKNIKEFRKDVLKCLELLKEEYGVSPILYVSVSYYKDFFSTEDFKDYPIWIAYYSNKPSSLDEIYWTFWQFTDNVLINGINHAVDVNVFKSSEKELFKYLVN